jgi:ABC-type multidrug transport system ATPase subunit
VFFNLWHLQRKNEDNRNIYKTGIRLSEENIDIYRLEGKFRNIRKTVYRIVAAVPLIGKKKKPFKALGCVSLNIGNGMFGLLGPNGAGKTTLMREFARIAQEAHRDLLVAGGQCNAQTGPGDPGTRTP